MKTAYSLPATPYLKKLSRYLTSVMLLIPCGVLAGWMMGNEFLKRGMPDSVAVNPLSAICFLFCAWSLWVQQPGTASGKRLRNARWMAMGVAVIGLGKIISVIAGIDFYLDALLFPDQIFDPLRNEISLMSPNSAACFAMTGFALYWLDREIIGQRRPAQYLSIVVMFIAILSLYGYVYGVKFLYGISSFKPMSLISGLLFLLMAVAILFSRPEKGTMAIIIGDTSAEVTLLRLAAFLVPLVMGWLKLKGEARGYFNTEFGTALFAIVTYALAMFLLARRSVVNYNMRALKREAQEELQKSHDRFLKFFNLSPEAKLITAAEDGKILYMNKAFEKMMALTPEEAIGRTTTELGIIGPEVRARVVQSIKETGLTKDIELKMGTGNGQVKDILLSLEVIDLDDRKCFLTNYLDISRRKELENTLREREQLLRAILDNMGEGVEVVDAEGKFLLVNPKAEELVGKRIDDNTHSDWIRRGVFYPDGVTPFPSEELALHQALKGIPVDNLEFKVMDGDMPEGRIIRSTSRPIKDGAGQVIAGVSVMNDITKRKEMEQQLRNSEERMRLIINTSLDAFIGMDEEGRITDWNRQAEITFGWSREEAIGRTVAETIIPERYRQSHIQGLKHFLVSGEGPVLNKRIEIEAWHRHGYEFPIELTITALKLARESVFCAFAHDITARRKHVEEIKHTSSFLDTILENIPNMIFVKDADELRFVRFNKAGEELLGYSRDDLLGKNDYNFFPQEQADFFTAKDREVIREGVLVNIPEEPIDTKEGKKWLHTKKITLKDDQGKPIYLMGISEDISERKKMEDALRENEYMLRAIVDTMAEGVVVCDTSGKILVYNAMAEEIMGQRPKGNLNNVIVRNEILYPDRSTPFPPEETSLKRALRGIVTENLELFVRNSNIPDGVFISSTGRPIHDRDGKLVAGVTMFRDISHRKELESLLKDTEWKLKEIVQSVSEGIVMCDASGKFILFNRQAEEMLGQGAHDIPPEEWPEKYHLYHPGGERLFNVEELLLMRALKGETVENTEVWIKDKDAGIEKYLLVSSRPVKDSSGTITAAIADFRDMTAMKHLESLFRDLESRYNHLILASRKRTL